MWVRHKCQTILDKGTREFWCLGKVLESILQGYQETTLPWSYLEYTSLGIIFSVVMQVMASWALQILGKCCATEFHAQPSGRLREPTSPPVQ